MRTERSATAHQDPHAGRASPDRRPRAGAGGRYARSGPRARCLGRGNAFLHRAIGIDALAAVAPQAAGGTWYPQSFLAPIESNQPYLDSALRADRVDCERPAGTWRPGERIAMLGFSQGACLTTEFVARHPRRYGAVMGLTGGLIGPPGTPRNYAGCSPARRSFWGRAIPTRTCRSSGSRRPRRF